MRALAAFDGNHAAAARSLGVEARDLVRFTTAAVRNPRKLRGGRGHNS
jgi:hypothetical protein